MNVACAKDHSEQINKICDDANTYEKTTERAGLKL